MRKGVYQATLDLVQSLCDTSSGLVDCFPMDDRLTALREVCGPHELCACDGFSVRVVCLKGDTRLLFMDILVTRVGQIEFAELFEFTCSRDFKSKTSSRAGFSSY